MEATTVRILSRATSERSVAMFKLAPEANGRAMVALKQYRSRLRPNETDRAELGRQLAMGNTSEASAQYLLGLCLEQSGQESAAQHDNAR